MRKGILSVLVLMSCVFLSSVQAQPYGPAREKARKAAKESSLKLDKAYIEVRELIQKSAITGDEDHDAFTLALFKDSHQQWKKLRDSQCSFNAHLEIYPAGSKLYTQTFNNCTAGKNKKYMKYLSAVENNIREARH
ncbi:MAG: DUF1311 domain-containing protein [Gammaproteobacteria bacterium]|nr:DUF1311 domain-containing protein [Gammaproteobacteria bacterium]